MKPAKVQDNVKLTTDETMRALADMYKGSPWTFLPQVRSATGWHRQRTADAIAMSVWPSRGLHLYGFEVKVSRSDWLKELRTPEKADEICAFCDFWYVVVGDPLIAFELVKQFPGRTSKELAKLGTLDRYQIARRLPELAGMGKVRREEIGNQDCKWYAILG